MKALLLKDWFVIWKQCRIMLLIPIVFALISGMMPGSDGDFFRLFSVVILAMFPITVIGLDEWNKWEVYAATMPYSKQDMVLSKYVLAVIGIVTGCGLSVIATAFLNPSAASWAEMAPVLVTIFTVGCIYTAFIMPVIFRFGVEKGRMWFIILAVLLAGGIGALNTMAQGQNSVVFSFLKFIQSSLLWLPVAGIVLLALSALLSISIYSKREFS